MITGTKEREKRGNVLIDNIFLFEGDESVLDLIAIAANPVTTELCTLKW